jgi:hypothetical protein
MAGTSPAMMLWRVNDFHGGIRLGYGNLFSVV